MMMSPSEAPLAKRSKRECENRKAAKFLQVQEVLPMLINVKHGSINDGKKP